MCMTKVTILGREENLIGSSLCTPWRTNRRKCMGFMLHCVTAANDPKYTSHSQRDPYCTSCNIVITFIVCCRLRKSIAPIGGASYGTRDVSNGAAPGTLRKRKGRRVKTEMGFVSPWKIHSRRHTKGQTGQAAISKTKWGVHGSVCALGSYSILLIIIKCTRIHTWLIYNGKKK